MLETHGSASILKKLMADMNTLNNVMFELENKYAKRRHVSSWVSQEIRDKLYNDARKIVDELKEVFAWIE